MIGIVGETVQLPCNFSLNKMREIELILWYKGQGTGKPIFTLDTRTTPLLKHLTSSTRRTDLYKSKLASASLLSKLQQSPIITTGTKRAENRFTFNLTGELAYLQIRQVTATDQSGYKCRVDYKQSRSDYHQVNLTVIGECACHGERSVEFHSVKLKSVDSSGSIVWPASISKRSEERR